MATDEGPSGRWLRWSGGADARADVGDQVFMRNYISTTKYGLLRFLPLCLLDQFRKAANVYFLIVAILSTFPMSPKSQWVSILPLMFVLSVSMAKEAVEDWRRFRMDLAMNAKRVDCWRQGQWRRLRWRDIRVGDMLYITSARHENAFPADLVLLQSSTPQGMCNIETSQLDGETNLKIKQAVGATYSIEVAADGRDAAERLGPFTLKSSAPNPKMDAAAWNGQLVLHNEFEDESDDEARVGKLRERTVALSSTQLLLRGCTLRNTDWIVAMTVFTGKETKLLLNSKKSVFKCSHVDKQVNNVIFMILALQATLCIVGAICELVFHNDTWYIELIGFGLGDVGEGKNAAEDFVLSVFGFLVLLDLMVPISLYVSLELVKLVQAQFINEDAHMVYDIRADEASNEETPQQQSPQPEQLPFLDEEEEDAEYDADDFLTASEGIPARARTSNLNEQLGQINFVFSDKTGTLTRNRMEFLRCAVRGRRYGPECEADVAAGRELGQRVRRRWRNAPPPAAKNQPAPATSHSRFFDPAFFEAVRGEKGAAERRFLLLLATCHSVIPEINDGELVYQAASPDELALVEMAAAHGFYFSERQAAVLSVGRLQVDGQVLTLLEDDGAGDVVVHKVEVLAMLDFDSTRKRMSVVVRHNGQVTLFCKGADNVILERLDNTDDWPETRRHLADFADEGLRTLCCAAKDLETAEFESWLREHQAASSALENRGGAVAASSERLENKLVLLGATAIEDRLQDGVPECMATLADAGMRVWILTGDKTQTAINIGRSCRLLTPRMHGDALLLLEAPDTASEEEARRAALDALAHAERVVAQKVAEGADMRHQGIVVSGRVLGFVFPHRRRDARGKEIPPTPEEAEEEQRLQRRFLSAAQQVGAVVACRVSPAQKAQLVQLVRENVRGAQTLAIGDGANDVPMIKAAHVGIGISGEEGLQAVQSSDYAVAQFRFLAPLLLVHGAWSYQRVSRLVLYSFMKNIAISITQFLFATVSGFSGQIFYEPVAGSLYNMLFTAFPVLLTAVFDRRYSRESALRYPSLYKENLAHMHFSPKLFLSYMLQSVYYAVVVVGVSLFVFSDASTTSADARDNDLWLSATAMLTFLVVAVNAKMALETHTFVNVSAPALVISVLLWFIVALIEGAMPTYFSDVAFAPQRLFSQMSFWFALLLCVALVVLPEVAVRHVIRMWWPSRLHVVQEREAGFGRHKLLDEGQVDVFDFGALTRKVRSAVRRVTPSRQHSISMRSEARELLLYDAVTEAAPTFQSASESASASQSQLQSQLQQSLVPSQRALLQSPEAAVVANSDLGYVDFLEDARDDTFVMPQSAFLAAHTAARNTSSNNSNSRQPQPLIPVDNTL